MTSRVTYTGELRTLATHLQSGSNIETDAPIDNHGKGERFSPTDLIGTSLAACMLTTMSIRAKELEPRLRNVFTETEKIMSAAPRRISGINIKFHWPTDQTFTEEEKKLLEEIAWSCPVKESIHPDIKLQVHFNW
ncbi:MAG: OsmC family protein [Bacteroidetes bacterium]|nr:OsmC family protein [Bacteroidota bacterium]